MSKSYAQPIKSTTDRTQLRSLDMSGLQRRPLAAHRWPAFRALSTLVSWIRDPLGIEALEGWSLDEEEIRADLDYGRD